MRSACFITSLLSAFATAKKHSGSGGGDDASPGDSAAASTPTEFLIPYANAGPAQNPLFTASNLEASFIAADATATTFAMQCNEDDDDDPCSLDQPISVTQGPSTFTLSGVVPTETLGGEATITMMQDCDIVDMTKAATCSISLGVAVSSGGTSTSVTVMDGKQTLTSKEFSYATVTAAPNAAPRISAGGLAVAAAVGVAAAGLL